MNNLKLGVEVGGAHDLLPKEGQGSSNSFIELQFDGQTYRTTTKEKDLNPMWNETFFFNISNPDDLSNLNLEAYIYNLTKANNSKTCLGKVRLSGTSFVPYSDAVALHYPLEKKNMFSRAKGELGLKVFLTDDPSIRSSNPLPAFSNPLPGMESDMPSTSRTRNMVDRVQNLFSSPVPGEKSNLRKRQTFHNLPKSSQEQYQRQEQYQPAPAPMQQSGQYGNREMRSGPPSQPYVQMYPGSSSYPADYSVKETSPFLGGGRIVGGRVIRADKPVGTYDLVEQMHYLYVRVVKAQNLPTKDVTGSLDPYVEVRLGNYKGSTQHFQKNKNPEWNEVFAFTWESMQSSFVDVVVKDKDLVQDDFVGIVRFDLNEVPTRVPPDSPLAPQWYRLEDKKGEKQKAEIMLAVWIGTQADEAFPDAWHSDAVTPDDGSPAAYTHIRSKVYHSPRLWYLRVNIIEAQDLILSDKNRIPSVHVKAQIDNQILKTKPVQTVNPYWNEDLMFVVAEPFEENLILSVEDRVGSNKDETHGKVIIPWNYVDKRADDRLVPTRWFNLKKSISGDVDQMKKDMENSKFASRIQVRVCLEGGYHVLDESTHYSSDLRPSAKQLWKPSIGVLELGILNADGLQPTKARDGRGTSDTYCVAKYGQKWIRTRTVISSLNPKYNEQYTWEVYDLATVLTVGVFDNGQTGGTGTYKDAKIGKVRIRISTLEAGRVYTNSYPLLVLHPSGVKKMGELHLAIRFSSTSMANMMLSYSRPLLPKMHYIRPLTASQLDMLRHQAVNIVAARLSRAEPPLRKEIVEYMSDADAHLWSMRRSKANFFRLMTVFSGLITLGKWLGEVCTWKNPVLTGFVHVLYLILITQPDMILPTVFLYMFGIGLWNIRNRPRHPPHMNTRLSYADMANPDELDEEFDSFPTSRSSDIVRARYDRLRIVGGRLQTVVGDMATQGERIQGLLSWRDPRATIIFMIFCLVSAFVLFVIPFQVLALSAGFYLMRHPMFRRKLPSAPLNFFRRLPARTDSML